VTATAGRRQRNEVIPALIAQCCSARLICVHASRVLFLDTRVVFLDDMPNVAKKRCLQSSQMSSQLRWLTTAIWKKC